MASPRRLQLSLGWLAWRLGRWQSSGGESMLKQSGSSSSGLGGITPTGDLNEPCIVVFVLWRSLEYNVVAN